MKKVFYFFAIAALTCTTACQREAIPEAEFSETEGTFSFTSVKPVLEDENPTRTEWTGETIQWSKDDQIRMAYTVAGVWQGASDESTAPKLYASNKLAEATEVAEFSVNTSFTSSATGTHIFYGLYPGTLSASDFTNAPTASITIPVEQTPAANSFDSAADVMIGVSEELEKKPSAEETVLMSWTRLVAHADLTIKNLSINEGETIDNVTLTAQDGADLVGMHSLNLVTGEVSNAQGATNEIVIKADNLTYANNTIKVWASMLPATLTELTVKVETDKAYYVRSFTGITREFKKNMRNTMNIGMTTAVRTEKAQNLVDYEEPFSDSFGQFTTNDVSLSGGLTYIWTIDTRYHQAKGSAYKSGNNAATSYLVSPELLIGTDKSKLSFYHAVGYLNGAAFSDYFTVVVIEGENETPLSLDVTPSTAGNFTEWKTSTVSLSSYVNKKIQIAFKYTSTTSVAGTWEIKDFKVTDVKTKLAAGLSFGENTEFEIDLGDSFTPPTLINPNNLTVTYESSDAEIAAVNETTGTVTLGEKAGTVTITATFEGNDDFNAGSASYTIKVTNPDATTVTDVINRAFTEVTGTSYANWSGKTGTSGAVYSGNSAGGNDAVQLRTTNNNSGIVTTASGGHATKVTVKWNSNTASGRTLNIYGKNSAYSAASDLYNSDNQGTLLGTIVNGTSTSLEISGNYTYIGLRSNKDPMYLDEIQIDWSSEAAPANPVITLSNIPTSNISADGDVVTINYLIENPVDGVSVLASATDTWVNDFDYSTAGAISFVVDPKTTSGTRTATITVSYTGAEEKTFQITQDGYSSGEEETAEYVFNTDAGLAALGIEKPASSKGTELGDKAYSVNGVSLTATSGNTATRVWNSQGATDLRIYSGGTFTFSVENKSITSIVMTGGTTGVFTADSGDFSSGTWVGSASSVTLTATGTGKINTITVTYE